MASGPSTSFEDSPGMEDLCSSLGSSFTGSFLERRGLLVVAVPRRSEEAGFSCAFVLKQSSRIAQDSRKAKCKADLRSRIVGPHCGGFAELFPITETF